jgi:mannose-6-phosphate isomerase-like protein (cupin superfamily)/ketosteroid isomerase-like protein
VARAGETVENPATGERITFVRTAADTSGELLVMDDSWTRPGHRAPEHVHPAMEERWEVVEGRAAFRIAGEELEAGPGETVVAPPATPHAAWNPTGEPVRLRIEMRPALRWEDAVERIFAGAPPVELLREFPREIAAPDPGVEAVRRGFGALQTLDMETFTADWHDDVLWDVSGYHGWPGSKHEYRGAAEILAEFAGFMSTVRSLQVDVREIRRVGRRVIALYTERRRETGADEEAELDIGILYDLDEGKIVRMEVHTGHPNARHAAGLE